MTGIIQNSTKDEPDIEPILPKYVIDPEWYKQNGLSLAIIIRSRIELLKGEGLKPKSKGKGEKAILASLKSLRPKSTDFIPPDLPILEAIFRVFLMDGNQPLTPVEIKDKLMDWWKDVGRYKDVEPQILKRLLDHDQYYGFRQLPTQD